MTTQVSTPNTPQELLKHFPTLNQHIGMRYLLKYGGAAMERQEVRESVCLEVALLANLGVKIVVVHGGGKEISRLLERLGIESHFIGGVRVTSPEAMLATEMVLSGLVNKQLSSLISLRGAAALGISGRDAHIVEAIPFVGKDGEDFGETGDISACDPKPIEKLLEANFVPVISPVGESASGSPRNLNADYTAAALAGAISARKAIFLTDVDGVRANGSIQPCLTATQINELIATGIITGGMIPKVECALRAINSGCTEAVICNAASNLIVSRAIIGEFGAGTVVARE
jgi:acetylglutamate kinase